MSNRLIEELVQHEHTKLVVVVMIFKQCFQSTWLVEI